MASRTEIEAGLAEAETELSRVRQRARELEELIALGTATVLAAEMISGGRAAAPSTAAPRAPMNDLASDQARMASDIGAAHEKSKDELQSRLGKAAQK
jgi:hypothetical protein